MPWRMTRPYFFRFDAACTTNQNSVSNIQELQDTTKRTCSALRRRLTFPPNVIIVIVLIKLTILILITITILVVVLFLSIIVLLLPNSTYSSRLLARGRRHGLRRATATDGRTGVAYAVWTEPLAVWDGGEGRIEARMVVRVIALHAWQRM